MTDKPETVANVLAEIKNLAKQWDRDAEGCDRDRYHDAAIVKRDCSSNLRFYVSRIERAMAASAVPVATYTTGHCKNNAQPGGCQLHNLQCGYPSCDRQPIIPPAVPVER